MSRMLIYESVFDCEKWIEKEEQMFVMKKEQSHFPPVAILIQQMQRQEENLLDNYEK